MNNNKDIHRRLKLENLETGQMYDLILSKSDYVRVLTDDEFTNSMLRHVKVVHSELPEAVPILMPSPEGNEPGEFSDAKNENEDCDNMEENSDMQNNSSTSNSKVLYSWQYDQVLALINVMGNHIHDLDNPKKRKDVFGSVTNDLISMKYNVNLVIVQNKCLSKSKAYDMLYGNRNWSTTRQCFQRTSIEKKKQERQEHRLREKMIKRKHRNLYKSMMKDKQARAEEIWLLKKKRRLHDEKQKTDLKHSKNWSS